MIAQTASSHPMKSFTPIFLSVVALHTAEPDLTREAATHGDRTPADAYGGSKIVEQPLTPDAAKVPYLIPDAIAPGPFSADWKSFTADKLKHEPDWWREAKIGVWFHWGPEFAELYTLKWFRRVKQFVDDYDPDMLYTDGTEPFTGRATAKGVISDATVKAVAHMYNKRVAKTGGTVDCMAVIRGGPRIPGIAAPHENGYTGPIKRTPWVWENTVGEWFYEENTLYDSRAMIFQMIEAISRDGNFNLNIGLTPEGDLEPGGVKMWQDFGEFTRRNSAAIYGSSAWKIIGEDAVGKDSIPRAFPSGPIVRQHAEFAMATSDVRFTHGKDGAVYAIITAVPKPGETLRIRSLGRDAKLLENAPTTVSLLGSEEKLQWKQEADALVITYPQSAAFPFAVVFHIN